VNTRALRTQAGPHAGAIRDRLDALRAARFAERLLAHDDALWGDDPAHRRVAAFAKSFDALLAALETRRREMVA